MATSIDAARQKFVRKMQGAGAKYDAAKSHMPGNYARGLQEIGVSVGPLTQQAYAEGIRSVSGSELAQRAANSADKWQRNYLQAMGR